MAATIRNSLQAVPIEGVSQGPFAFPSRTPSLPTVTSVPSPSTTSGITRLATVTFIEMRLGMLLSLLRAAPP